MQAKYCVKSPENDLGHIIYTPDNCTKGLPLMVFLHGAGERGDDLELVNVNAVPKLIKNGSIEVPAIVLCPQCPQNFVWNNLVIKLKALIDSVAKEYDVDLNKISITGISMGGYGTWEMGLTYPEFFCAIAPVCGGGLSWRCNALTKMPIWAHHGDADATVPVSNSLEMVDKVNAMGGHAKLTIYHGVGHNSWDPAYTETVLISWLLQQKRV